MKAFIAPHSASSWPGLTRPSIQFRETRLTQTMDCRVKPGNDDKQTSAAQTREQQ
jgi:hypothetical protein